MRWRRATGACCAALFLALPAALAAQPANAEDEAIDDYDPEETDMIIHSDLPLWRGGEDETQEIYPQHFSSDDGFGCAHRVHMGTWRYLEWRTIWRADGSERSLDPEAWYRFSHLGMFHCATGVAVDFADTLEDARFDDGRSSLWIDLGEVEARGRTVNLWAVQLGFMPGSDYWLLAEDWSEESTIGRFEMLQRRCSRKQFRSAGAIDAFRTDYCAINSRKELIVVAREMAQLEPLGFLEAVEQDVPADDEEQGG